MLRRASGRDLNGEQVELGPGERTAVVGAKLSKEEVQSEVEPAWKRGISRMDGVPYPRH